MRGFDVLARYHRLEVRGLERIPEGPALLVGNHNGGLNPVDGLFLVEYYRRYGYDDPVYALAHDVLFRFPRMKRTLESVGIVPARKETARELLEAGHKVLVFPGGDIENMRPFRERKQVNLAGRTGFVKLAQQTGVPIVPVVGAGNHETLIVLSQGRRIAEAMGLDRMRVHSMPLILAPPWGLITGPTLVLPYMPLPAKVTVQIGDPVAHDRFHGVANVVRSTYEHVENRMQTILSDLYAERHLPVLG